MCPWRGSHMVMLSARVAPPSKFSRLYFEHLFAFRQDPDMPGEIAVAFVIPQFETNPAVLACSALRFLAKPATLSSPS